MKDTILICILFALSTLSMFAQETEKVVEIKDLRNLTEEERTKYYDSRKQHQNYDVEVVRDFVPPDGGYLMSFYLNRNDTLEPVSWGLGTDVNYDKLYYQWHGDSVLGRFQNSSTKDSLRVRWTFEEDGSSRQELLDIPE